ncbi:hypothetical protein [Methanocaldococcus fervens]|uniref:Lipoprotein n=1 Tax=Methanocaldococcus fervens (strain DSM 4213 / JCM 15782 / AG86) TaxID=573064 RepID=C7P981_METFA|nr:hypothetical protein [Methanocaldococcus fervens]ACV25113.1 hypothetical protein Mefer_1304 [Methanocaldococcus fervens AG86]
MRHSNLCVFIIFTLIISVMSGCTLLFPKKYPDFLYKEYNVVKIENKTINGVNVAIVYQVKSNIGSRPTPYSLDADSKRDIGEITYYVFKNTDVDEVQIICYYAGKGELQPYYKFKIRRKEAELSGLLNATERELPTVVIYSFDKLKSLGDLWINSRLSVYG